VSANSVEVVNSTTGTLGTCHRFTGTHMSRAWLGEPWGARELTFQIINARLLDARASVTASTVTKAVLLGS
jgi:hypothetical protein